MTHKEIILVYLKTHPYLTTFEAYEKLGIVGLPSRISELRKDGNIIIGEPCKRKNRYNKTILYYKYRLIEEYGETKEKQS